MLKDRKPSYKAKAVNYDAVIKVKVSESVKHFKLICEMIKILSSFLHDIRKHLILIYRYRKSKFQWKEECEKAFESINIY